MIGPTPLTRYNSYANFTFYFTKISSTSCSNISILQNSILYVSGNHPSDITRIYIKVTLLNATFSDDITNNTSEEYESLKRAASVEVSGCFGNQIVSKMEPHHYSQPRNWPEVTILER